MMQSRGTAIVSAILLLAAAPVRAQQMDTGSIFSQPVLMDTFVVKSGFDINAFIRRVRTDTTFYKCFRSLHLVPYSAVNAMTAFDKHGNTEATYHSATRQVIANKCRKTEVVNERTTGNFYKRNGDHNYYTAALFAYLFFSADTVCNEDDIVAGKMQLRETGRMGKSKYQLKQLIFNPGSRVSGIPFMADRASIFEEDEAKKYDFAVSVTELDGEACYQFRITPKKGYEKDVLYNELVTWFRKGDYTILARDYSLSYHTLVYDFDVQMKVRTTTVNGKLLPLTVYYKGDWHVVSQGRERMTFTTNMTY